MILNYHGVEVNFPYEPYPAQDRLNSLYKVITYGPYMIWPYAA